MGDLLDGLSLWDEHKPQSGEDWVAVAERFIADGCTTEDSSPLFAALVLAVRQREQLDQALHNIALKTHDVQYEDAAPPAVVRFASRIHHIARQAREGLRR